MRNVFNASLRLGRIVVAPVYSVLRLLALYPRYVWIDTLEYLRCVKRYYPNAQFRRADLRCLFAYVFKSADTVCVRYARGFEDDRVQKIYGETFFTTLEQIAHAVDLRQDDVIYDLGCGRGRGVFWFNAFYRCRAVGVDINPTFMRVANRIKAGTGMHGVEFITANLLDVDYSDASVIYLYGTAFNDAALTSLVARLATLAPGTRIVSVSARLTNYTPQPLFELVQTLQGNYLWGRASIFIYKKR